MYLLTLTVEERKEVGRNCNGFNLRRIMSRCDTGHTEIDWSTPETVTFQIPEKYAFDLIECIPPMLACESLELNSPLYVKLANLYRSI